MLRVVIVLTVCSLSLAILYYYLVQTPAKSTMNGNETFTTPSNKPVVMIIVDSLMDTPLQKVIKDNNAPALQFLLNNGTYHPEVVSSYPTMSVSIDSTLLTGTYPDQHKVPALVWYDEDEKRLISYGSASKEIMKLGPKQVLTDSLFHLNEKHLSQDVKTLHEELGTQTASINTLVFRGNQKKQLNIPRILQFLKFAEQNAEVQAPAYFSYGLLSRYNPRNNNTHLWQGFGFNDKFAAEELTYLIQENRLPAFSIVYFSDNDKEVHKSGENVTKGIVEADKKLQEVLDAFGSWEEAINNITWIVMGDSGQTYIKNNKKEALVDLRTLLKDYRIHKINEPIQKQDQIVLGLNERMSFVYLLDDEMQQEEIATLLKSDSRIDVIAWKEGNWVKVISGDKSGSLSFKPGGQIVDPYGQAWTLEGDEKILDIYIKDNQITYQDYPDGLARLYSSFFSHSGKYLVINAMPGYEFIGEGSPRHVGGASHGSLHKDDTHFPMIVAGTDVSPKHDRVIDFKEWILQLVNQK